MRRLLGGIMKIVLGTDHRGFEQKEFIKKRLSGDAIEFIDVGCFSPQPTDYPILAREACMAIQKGYVQKGILLCGSGVGMSIAANRFAGIYAALVWSEELARLSVADDNANVLVFPADFLSTERMITCIQAWLQTDFKGEHYERRLQLIDSWGGVKG